MIASEDASAEGTAPAPQADAQAPWSSNAENRALRHLYSAPMQFTQEWVEAPVGAVAIPVPVPGADDVAVLQMMQFDTPFISLPIAIGEAEPLDEALAVGYPFSRLKDGRYFTGRFCIVECVCMRLEFLQDLQCRPVLLLVQYPANLTRRFHTNHT